MKRITTTIKREFLDQIIAGTKTVEYRELKPYWQERLGMTICPFELRMINGMSKTAPEVTVLIDQIVLARNQYELQIAEILDFKNVTIKARVRKSISSPIEGVEVFGKLYPLIRDGKVVRYDKRDNTPVRLLHVDRLWWLHYGYDQNTGAFKSRKGAERWWDNGGR